MGAGLFEVDYTPGTALAACGPRLALLAAIEPDDPAGRQSAAAVADAAARMEDVLKLLVRHARVVNDFVVAEARGDGVLVVLRGRTAAETVEVRIEGRGQWRERVLHSAEVVLFESAEEELGEISPLIQGAVRASSLRLRRRPAGSSPEVEGGPPVEVAVATVTNPLAGGERPQVPSHSVEVHPDEPETGVESTDASAIEGGRDLPSTQPDGSDDELAAVLTTAGHLLPEMLAGPAITLEVDRPSPRRAVASPTVLAARCGRGHLSAAFSPACRVCGSPMEGEPFDIARPSLGVLRTSSGHSLPLERDYLLGRNPDIPADWVGPLPTLVRVPDPERDVSVQHAAVRLDHWHVTVTDLGSTNGTEMIRPGQLPEWLRPHEPVVIEPGTVIVLAGVFRCTFEATG
jgi:hypothetical protein